MVDPGQDGHALAREVVRLFLDSHRGEVGRRGKRAGRTAGTGRLRSDHSGASGLAMFTSSLRSPQVGHRNGLLGGQRMLSRQQERQRFKSDQARAQAHRRPADPIAAPDRDVDLAGLQPTQRSTQAALVSAAELEHRGTRLGRRLDSRCGRATLAQHVHHDGPVGGANLVEDLVMQVDENLPCRTMSTFPSGVRLTRRVVRTKSGVFSRCSSRRMSRLMACWATNSR